MSFDWIGRTGMGHLPGVAKALLLREKSLQTLIDALGVPAARPLGFVGLSVIEEGRD